MHCNYVDSAKEALGMLLGLGFQLLFFGWIHELCTAVHDRSSRRKGMIHWFHPAVAIALAAAIENAIARSPVFSQSCAANRRRIA